MSVGFTGENVAMESLLPIVASQRERFKIRNMELEAVSYTPGEFLFSFFRVKLLVLVL